MATQWRPGRYDGSVLQTSRRGRSGRLSTLKTPSKSLAHSRRRMRSISSVFILQSRRRRSCRNPPRKRYRIPRRLQLQEVHVVFSFAFGAAIFHRQPPATLFEGQNVDGYGGVEFFEKDYLFCLNGKIRPLDFERVFVICVLWQMIWVMGGWV